jgi:hypothetical protein
MGGLVANTILRHTGVASVTIFLPVYIFSIGGMNMLVWYLIISRGMEFLASQSVEMLVGKIGFKWSMLSGSILLAIALILLEQSQNNPALVYLAALVVPFSGLLYWISYHLLFMQNSEKEYGKRAGWLTILTSWSAVLGPIAGGLLISFFGFGSLFVWGIVLIVLSIVPVWLLEPDNLKWEFHLSRFWSKLGNNWFRRDLIAHVGRGIEEILLEFFWPVFLITLLGGSHLQLGVYKTLVLAASSILLYFIGHKIDINWPRRNIILGILVLGVFWIVRGYLKNQTFLLGLDILDGLVALAVFFPFSVYAYHRAKHSDGPLYLTEKEASLSLGRAFAAILVGVFFWMGLGWQHMVWIGVLGLVLMSFVPSYEVTKATN